MSDSPGVLDGVRVIELTGVGPGPFCGMLLADMGADVLRIERAAVPIRDPRADILARGQRSVAMDLKNAQCVALVLDLVANSDALIDPFRPGVAESLGLGPQACHERNPRLVYGRMTGWGQDGPLASRAGHDLNYLARNGVLSLVGRAGQPPVPPLNLVGDFGGGAMFLTVGILAGILRARVSGQGQVVDAAMVDGAALLTAMVHQLRALGQWSPERGNNVLDTGAPWYDVYETADGGYMSVGAMEPQFYDRLLQVLELESDPVCRARETRDAWPEIRRRFTKAFKARSRSAWEEIFAAADACVEPVLSIDEALTDSHMVDRGTYLESFGFVQPAPAPRFAHTPSVVRRPPPFPGEHSRSALLDWGVSQGTVASLIESGAVIEWSTDNGTERN